MGRGWESEFSAVGCQLSAKLADTYFYGKV